VSWLDLAPDDPFGLHVLPYGVVSTGDAGSDARLAVRVGDCALDLAAAARHLLPSLAPLLGEGSLNPLMAAGPDAWREVRAAVQTWLTDERHREVVEPLLHRLADLRPVLPFAVADYVDFYSSEHHAVTVGRLFRPDGDPLVPSWKHLPIGYHGRAGTVLVSGSPVVRPSGHRRDDDGQVVFGPSTRLDLEAEVGFVVGVPSRDPVPLERFADHVFGVVLVDDWSARDVQAFEYVPLGPFLGKAFATSVSSWVVPLEALQHARVPPPVRDPRPVPHLDDTDSEPWGLDLRMEVRLNGSVVSRPPFASTYWTAAQQLAHLTSAAAVRTGDLFASGTVSGPGADERGCLLELSSGGAQPVRLDDGSTRTFLEDGDEVVISATAPGPGGAVVGLGEVRGTVLPAR
jgi:fumarylacetoacetase